MAKFIKGASGNPKGRPRKKSNKDGWFNALGYGTSRDKTRFAGFGVEKISFELARDLYRGDWLPARIVDLIPQEALRAGLTFESGDKSKAAQINALAASLNAVEVIGNAWKNARWGGGGAVLIGALDGTQDLSLPLNLARVRNVVGLTALEACELSPVDYYNDAASGKLGQVATWRLTSSTQTSYTNTVIHESRLLIFRGVRVGNTALDYTGGPGFGDTILNRVHKVLRQFDISWSAAGVLLSDFAQAVYKIKGLDELIAGDGAGFRNRMDAIELGRSALRATILDADLEDFKREVTPISGLPEMLDRFMTLVSAAAGIPVTRLMMQSPAGLNATGESDTRHFYDDVSAERARACEPQVQRLATILGAVFGVTDCTVAYPPLWQPSESERAKARLDIATTDEKYVQMGAVDGETVARSRWGSGVYSAEMRVDFDALKALEVTAADQPPTEPKDPNVA